MKNFFLTLTLLTFVVVSFSSCVATNKSFQSSPVISKNVELDPIKADIRINEETKLRGKSSSSYFLGMRVSGDKTFADGIHYNTPSRGVFQSGKLNKVRGAAAYNALSLGDYDVLINPNYTITIKNYLIVKKYKVTVEGYGGKYENFRTEKQKIVIFQDGKEIKLQDKQ